MRLRDIVRNRFFVDVAVCCCLFFLVFRPAIAVTDGLLRPVQNPERIPVAIVAILSWVLLYFLTAVAVILWLHRKIWPDGGAEKK